MSAPEADPAIRQHHSTVPPAKHTPRVSCHIHKSILEQHNPPLDTRHTRNPMFTALDNNSRKSLLRRAKEWLPYSDCHASEFASVYSLFPSMIHSSTSASCPSSSCTALTACIMQINVGLSCMHDIYHDFRYFSGDSALFVERMQITVVTGSGCCHLHFFWSCLLCNLENSGRGLCISIFGNGYTPYSVPYHACWWRRHLPQLLAESRPLGGPVETANTTSFGVYFLVFWSMKFIIVMKPTTDNDIHTCMHACIRITHTYTCSRTHTCAGCLMREREGFDEPDSVSYPHRTHAEKVLTVWCEHAWLLPHRDSLCSLRSGKVFLLRRNLHSYLSPLDLFARPRTFLSSRMFGISFHVPSREMLTSR